MIKKLLCYFGLHRWGKWIPNARGIGNWQVRYCVGCGEVDTRPS